jgi:mRNA interferase MazF
VSRYIPDQGDLVWIEFNPQAGHEQAGHRPAITLSRIEYNRKTDLAVFCPITSKVKKYPFEVIVAGKKVQGVVLADQVKSLDWKVRKVKFIEKAENSVLQEVLSKFRILIEEPTKR